MIDNNNYQNSLIVLIALSGTSTLPINDIPISVESSKHGIFERGEFMEYNAIDKSQQRTLFVKKLELDNRFDILKKINDDVITVKVGGQIYEFLNPEIELE